MNLGSIVRQGDGRIDPEAVERALERAAQPAHEARVTVREWDARTQRHAVLWEGPMRRDHIEQLAAGRGAIGAD